MGRELGIVNYAIRDAGEASALRTLNSFAVDVMAIRSADDLFWYVARNVVGRLNFVDCVIYEADHAGTELRQVAALGEKNPYDRTILNPLRIPFGEGITGRTAATGQPIVVEDLLQDQNYIPDTEPARSEICVPLISMGRVVGVIDSEHPEPRAFGDAELEVLTTVAAMTSAKLELLAEAERSSQRYHELVSSHAKLAEEATIRKALEAQLFEARKLEAIGRLTGGFAHSFNNLLTVISGNIDLVREVDLPEHAEARLRDARSAAGRGAQLIRDMIAFSQRMQLKPRPVDLKLLVPEICERAGTDLVSEVVLDLASDTWIVNIDPAATEVALVNLMMNARDAMSEGGALQITTRNVTRHIGASDGLELNLTPGRYVRLDVTDQGEGIPPEIVERIFDPFFTTKAVGRGTGLGLSMVQGFMKQSGGAVAVQAAEPHGTTFQLYFPAIE
ncbi:MAG: ATP-binding protein [Pseudomonadota bacterium]